MSKPKLILPATLIILAVWLIGTGLYIPAKAEIAQFMLQDAWQRTLTGEDRAKPWPWADTWPVARLRAPRYEVELFVLAGATGATLAFGPGHLHGTPAPGRHGSSVIGGHRDTNLSFLRRVQGGDQLILETPDGNELIYRVTGSTIADARKRWPNPEVSYPMLTLVTCYPFDAVTPGGPLRYLVFAEATGSGKSPHY